MAAMTTNCYFLPMTRVLLIAYDGAQSLDVSGPAEVFASAARAEDGRVAPRYQVTLASIGGGLRETTSGLRVETRDLRAYRARADDIVIVAGGSELGLRKALADRALRAWLERARRVVRVMASVCSGAFLLAAAGILNGKRAATHWACCDRLAQAFPEVRVDANAIFIEDGSVWTSAGVTTGIDMALALVERDHGRALADTVASRLVLYARRPGYQSQFSRALLAQREGDQSLGAAIAWARVNLAQADVDSLARRAALSARTLYRRCQQTLRTTPARLLDKLRVERACSLLETSEISLKQLASECGFASAMCMNRAFARELGMSPRAYGTLNFRASAR